MVSKLQNAPDPPLEPELTFESATERLSVIVAELERGELPLETALLRFEEGVRLSRLARERITAAERRVEELLGVDAEGSPETRPFPSGGR